MQRRNISPNNSDVWDPDAPSGDDVVKEAMARGIKKMVKLVLILVLVPVILVIVAAVSAVWTYNGLQERDEGVKAAWSQVVNVYKRRADLIPNLVSVVQGYAEHERDLLNELTAARAKVGQMTVNADDAESLAAFQAAQGQLQGAMGRLLSVSENYPDLKASDNFRDLQAQIEGTENRVTVERQRYIEAVASYNTAIRKFPGNLIAAHFDFKERPNFTVENAASVAEPPKVEFGKPSK